MALQVGVALFRDGRLRPACVQSEPGVGQVAWYGVTLCGDASAASVTMLCATSFPVCFAVCVGVCQL